MDIFFTVPAALLAWLLTNIFPIAIGALLMLVFAVLFLHRNLKTRPQWVFSFLARYASKLEPVQDWYERMHTLLIRERVKLEQKKQAETIKDRADRMT